MQQYSPGMMLINGRALVHMKMRPWCCKPLSGHGLASAFSLALFSCPLGCISSILPRVLSSSQKDLCLGHMRRFYSLDVSDQASGQAGMVDVRPSVWKGLLALHTHKGSLCSTMNGPGLYTSSGLTKSTFSPVCMLNHSAIPLSLTWTWCTD